MDIIDSIMRGPCRAATLTLAAFGVLALDIQPADALPREFVQEGLITDDDGRPLEGERRLRARLYATPRGGEVLFEEVHQVELFQGYYMFALGSIEVIDPDLFLRDEIYLGLTIDDGRELTPRTALRMVPAAFTAEVARNVTGDITPRSVSIPGVGMIINAEGQWVGNPVGLRGPPGGDGSPDTPEQVRDKLRQVDGPGSQINADQLDGIEGAAFMRADQDTSTAGTLRVGRNLEVAGDVSVRGLAAGNLRLNDVPGHSYMTLFRPDRSVEAGLRYQTGGGTDWWQFVDNNNGDRDLRWRSPGGAGFSDRAPQLRLTEAGDLHVGRSLRAGQDLTVPRTAQVGYLRVTGQDSATVLLRRAAADQHASVRFDTGNEEQWRMFLDNNADDRDLRFVAARADGFGDRNPQMRLTEAGHLNVGGSAAVDGPLQAERVLIYGPPAAPQLEVRPSAAPAAGAATMVVSDHGGREALRFEINGGNNRPAIAGNAAGLDVLGGPANGGHLTLKANRQANVSTIEVTPNRINLKSLSGGAEAQSYLSVVGPFGRVGVGTENPGAQLEIQAARNEVALRQARDEAGSYDLDVRDDNWTLAMTGEEPLITAEGPAQRVHLPSLVITPLEDAPAAPMLGQLYFDRGDNELRLWDGEDWLPIPGAGGGGGGGGDDDEEVQRTIPGFNGTMGPDLSDEGLTQCYGWTNDGRAPAPSLATMRVACGVGLRVAFVGHRCDGGLVRHDMTLRSPLSEYLIGERRFWRDFDVDSRYSWHMSGDWALLVRFGNGWSDPGRLWEPYIGGNNGNVGATYGHVLSQNGNQAHDQHRCTGDAYYIYYEPEADPPEPAVRGGLIGFWPLDGHTLDVSGNGLHGRAEGGMRFDVGRRDEAAVIDANDDAVRVVDDGNSLLDARTVTMAAWVYPYSCRTPGDRGIIMNKESVYEYGLQNGTCQLQAAFSPCWRWWGTRAVPANQWSHVAIVHDGNRQHHYINGDLVESTACAGLIAVNNSDFKIGSRNGDGANGSDFNGLIDEAYLFSRALNAGEVARLFSDGVGEPGRDPANAVRSCRQLNIDAPGTPSGVYWLDPDGAAGDPAFQAYCDMDTDGGGWTMCYTTSRYHHLDNRGFAGTYGQNGYRTNCREVPFHEVIYRNHASGQNAMFRRNNGQDTTIEANGFNTPGDRLGLWTARGDARANWSYQLNICDRTWMQVGLMMSGYTNCWKACNSWCGDRATDYYRTNGEGNGVNDGNSYHGVSFRENGHRNVADKLMSVGIR